MLFTVDLRLLPRVLFGGRLPEDVAFRGMTTTLQGKGKGWGGRCLKEGGKEGKLRSLRVCVLLSGVVIGLSAVCYCWTSLLRWDTLRFEDSVVFDL